MKQIEGTKTEENIINVFNGQTQSSIKYQFFAERARQDGYEQIANIFDITAHNEKELAKVWYKFLNDGIIPNTAQNLKSSIAEEIFEWTTQYQLYADEARADGFEPVARQLERIADIEDNHRIRFEKLLQNIETGQVFSRDGGAKWECINCGYLYIGRDAPVVCPVCGFPQAFYEIKAENY